MLNMVFILQYKTNNSYKIYAFRRLKNDDFRRLLATPSNNSTTSGSTASVQAEQKPSHQFTHRQTSAAESKPSKKGGKNWPPNAAAHVTKEKRDKDNIFDESQARLNEILNKYRDRAAERRKGMVPEDEDLRNRLAVFSLITHFDHT